MVGCSQTTSASPSTTLAPLPVGPTSTTLFVPTVIANVEGYVGNVYDGRTFDFSQGKESPTRRVLADIQVPDVGTCNGVEARALLASMIAGKKVIIEPTGRVLVGDTDVALTMVIYGYAKSAGESYQAADAQSVDFDCASTTTTSTLAPTVVVVAPPSTSKPKQKKTTTTVEAVVETEPAEPPPPARTQPAATPAPATPAPTQPKATATQPKATQPAPTQPRATQPAPTQATPAPTSAPPPATKPPPVTRPPKETKPPKETTAGTTVAATTAVATTVAATVAATDTASPETT